MNNGMIVFFNPLYTLCAILALNLSICYFRRIQARLGFEAAFSLWVSSLLSLAASVIPPLAKFLTISFIPDAVYHALSTLTLAPLVVFIVGFFMCWAFMVLMKVFACMFSRNLLLPHLGAVIMAMIVFGASLFQIRDGVHDYQVVANAQTIFRNAANSTDEKLLRNIYASVVRAHDKKILGETLTLLAMNTHSSSHLLSVVFKRAQESKLNNVKRDFILLNLSKNPNTPPETLQRILVSFSKATPVPKADSVLAMVSRNPNFSQDTLMQFAAYPDCEIRRSIIYYPKISESTLKQIISHDQDLGVRRDAKRRLEFLHGMSRPDAEDRAPVKNANDELVAAAEKAISSGQLTVIFDKMLDKPNQDAVMVAIAKNCSVTPLLLQKIYNRALKLSGYARTKVLAIVAQHPKTSPRILYSLISENELLILRALANNPNLPYQLVGKLSNYPDCKIRKEIICSPLAQTPLIKSMRSDPDQSVSMEAIARSHQPDTYLDICQQTTKHVASACQANTVASDSDMNAFPDVY